MIKEQYVSLSTAKLAKEKGYNELCCTIYKDGLLKIHKSHNGNNYSNLISNKGLSGKCFSAPTQSILARWFREIHHINVEAICLADGYRWRIYQDGIATYSHAFDNYEEAMESGLQNASDRIKKIIK